MSTRQTIHTAPCALNWLGFGWPSVMRFEVVAMMMVHLFDEVEDWVIDDNVKAVVAWLSPTKQLMQLLQSVAAPAGTDFVIVECELSPRRNILNVFRISQKIKAKLWCNPFNTTLWIVYQKLKIAKIVIFICNQDPFRMSMLSIQNFGLESENRLSPNISKRVAGI